jgi:hypothetical protein
MLMLHFAEIWRLQCRCCSTVSDLATKLATAATELMDEVDEDSPSEAIELKQQIDERLKAYKASGQTLVMLSVLLRCAAPFIVIAVSTLGHPPEQTVPLFLVSSIV